VKQKIKNVRAIAALAVEEVVSNGRSIDSALDSIASAESFADPRDRGLVQEMLYGCIRQYFHLDALTDELIQKPLKRKDQIVRLLLMVGLYQLEYMSTKAHAAVAETVAAVTELGKPWAKGLLNACLRRFQRERDELMTAVETAGDEVVFEHPGWLLKEISADWPEQWKTIAQQNNLRPPMHLRVNQKKNSRESVVEQLMQSGKQVSLLPTACGLKLENPAPVSELPGFSNGNFSVQDLSAQYAAILLTPEAGDHVLDACAAPGGKACHLLELAEGKASLVAVELDESRAKRINENMQRLNLSAELKVADASLPNTWWDGVAFDRILLDAPCSATGVIRRHPDIKLHRRASDIDKLVALQSGLLDAMWPLLKRGGKLLYATCSILKRENELQIEKMLARHGDAREIPVAPTGSIAQRHGAQFLPEEGDGFYYCMLEKI